MSHCFAIVLVPADRKHDLVQAVEESMARFDEEDTPASYYDNEDAYDNAHWWDWYRVGGRWDGTILALAYSSAPGCVCATDESACHYKSDRHESLARNSVPVLEMGECRPFTLVTPEGTFSHRQHFVPDPSREHWPWSYVDNENHDRWCAEQLLAHRDCIAVGVDYHS